MALTTTTYGYTKERSGEARPVSPDIAAVEPGSLTFEINHMDLFYGDHHALKDVSMDIRTHEITALIGPSGCGKSTFLKSLNRMNDLVENCRITGDIRFEGKDIFREVDLLALRTRVGRVFPIKANSPASWSRACARRPAGTK